MTEKKKIRFRWQKMAKGGRNPKNAELMANIKRQAAKEKGNVSNETKESEEEWKTEKM